MHSALCKRILLILYLNIYNILTIICGVLTKCGFSIAKYTDTIYGDKIVRNAST